MSPAVARVIREAFGDAAIEGLVPVTGGRSGATLLAFEVEGTAYVLRQGDPSRSTREITCMQIASKSGVAPALRYVDLEAGLSIMERVPVDRDVPRDEARTARVAATLRALHEGPAFPAGPSLVDVIRHFDGMVRARTGFGLPDDVVATVTALEGEAAWVVKKPCHLDLNPGNVLETRTRIYFVDWEIAGQGDPYLDVAQLGVFSPAGRDTRLALLEAYLERTPTDVEIARLHDARIRALGLYCASFYVATVMATGKPIADEGAPTVAEAVARLASERERASPAIVASALRAEMQRELAAR